MKVTNIIQELMQLTWLTVVFNVTNSVFKCGVYSHVNWKQSHVKSQRVIEANDCNQFVQKFELCFI